MIKRKGKFLTFCFSMLPGAGHMYLGFMKQGISLMLFFFTTLFLTDILNLGSLLFFLPIIWFYSFFDVMNKNSMLDEDFYRLRDDYMFNMDFSSLSGLVQGKFRKIVAYVLILIGISLLFSNFRFFLGMIFSRLGIYFGFFDRIPQLILAGFIILVGIRLIQGKKFELLEQEDAVYADMQPADSQTDATGTGDTGIIFPVEPANTEEEKGESI